MKNLVAIALLMVSVTGFAQMRNSVYVDVGLTNVGASATYDWRLARHFMLGAGVDIHDYNTDKLNLRTSVYADLRPYWQIRRSQIFVPIDLGISFYSGREAPAYSNITDSKAGLHLSFGVGYCYRVTRRGAGPYATIMWKGYGFSETTYDFFGNKHEDGIYEAMALFSVGFKF